MPSKSFFGRLAIWSTVIAVLSFIWVAFELAYEMYMVMVGGIFIGIVRALGVNASIPQDVALGISIIALIASLLVSVISFLIWLWLTLRQARARRRGQISA